MIAGRAYKAHRLAWLIETDSWPEGPIDHINGDTGDNRIANLRLATVKENIRNQRRHKDNHSGFKGVHQYKRRLPGPAKWVARVCVDGKEKYLGLYRSREQAARAYDEAARQYHGEFARLNFPA